jgi:hypothetical protein
VRHPITAGDANHEGHGRGDNGAGKGGEFEEETHAVFKGAAVRRWKTVGGGRKSGVEEVAVGGMDFDCLG